jgi:hypothetical protein
MLKFMEPPLDEDGAICRQDLGQLDVLHRDVGPNTVPSRYHKHFEDHGWRVVSIPEGMILQRDSVDVEVGWIHYQDGTWVSLRRISPRGTR